MSAFDLTEKLAKPFFDGDVVAILGLKEPQLSRCEAVALAFRVHHACKCCTRQKDILARAEAEPINDELCYIISLALATRECAIMDNAQLLETISSWEIGVSVCFKGC